jgi:hemin uptake protein HemP
MDRQETPQSQAPVASKTPTPQAPVVLDSNQLLAGRKQVSISHGGELYSLRLTRNGKLILTK